MDLDSDYLDLPSRAPVSLNRLAEERLRELSLMTGAQRAGPIGGNESARQKPGSVPPKGARDDVGAFRRQYAEATTNRGRLSVLRAVQDRINMMRYAPSAEKVRGTLDWKVAIATDPRPSHVVGSQYHISGSYVRVLRKALRDGELGGA